jgi:CheY-like chemotaxis protein
MNHSISRRPHVVSLFGFPPTERSPRGAFNNTLPSVFSPGLPVESQQGEFRPRVYLVEDSPIIRNLLVELIETTGATVIGYAETASDAIAEIASLHPDIVTVDILLKAGTGFDVLEGMAINHEDDPPLRIVLTNYSNDAYRDAARRLGVTHFFDKAREIRDVLGVLATFEPRVAPRGALAA